MTREEYIRQLNDALRLFPADASAAAIDFYTEMLDDRMEDGLDEESAVAAMESPADIAARLRAEVGEMAPAEEAPAEDTPAQETAPVQEARPEAASPLHVGIRDEALEFASLADSALRGIQEAMRAEAPADARPIREAAEEKPAPNTQADEQPAAEKEAEEKPASDEASKQQNAPFWQDIMHTAMETAGSALDQAGREVDKWVNEAKAQQKVPEDFERKEISCAAEDINAVNISVLNMPVRISPAADGRFTLVYYTSPWAAYEASAENGVLTLKGRDKERNRGFGFFISSGLKMIFSQSAPPAELYVPAGSLPDVDVHTSNGSILAEHVHGLCKVTLTTSNSRISLKDVTCKSLRVQTSNSRLVLENVQSKTTLWGQTSNARIEAYKTGSSREMTLKTSNGRVQLSGVAAGGALTATSSNGSLTVEGLSAPAIILRTSNSGIHGTLPGRAGDWRITSSTSNGSNSLPRNQEGTKPLDVRTSNGSIKLSFEKG